MSSRFVSGGTISASGDGQVSTTPAPATELSAAQKKAQAEWASVQADLDAERAKREAERQRAASGQGDEGKSLYEVLQANKAAKQAAFEEATKIRNQFRSLDEDEVGFLDEVREKKRKEDEGRKKEIEDGLKGFKEMQKRTAIDETTDEGLVEAETGDWTVGRKKRKVARDAIIKKSEKPDEKPQPAEASKVEEKVPPKVDDKKKPAMGLVAYDSDDSDNE